MSQKDVFVAGPYYPPGTFATKEDQNISELTAEVARLKATAITEHRTYWRRQTEETKAQLQSVYKERNQCVALLARMAIALGLPAGVAQTAIEGWDAAWHGCVYIDLPTGQVSWHFHSDETYLFNGLPPYTAGWDGHDTPEKYRRVNDSFQKEEAAIVECAVAHACEIVATQTGRGVKEMKKGDYVLATKYGDGDAHDHWSVGFFDRTDKDASGNDRHFVVDGDGNQFRGNGFRRIAKITGERGAWMLKKARWIELSGRSVWHFAECEMEERK